MMLPEIPSRYLKIFLGFIGGVFIANVLILDFFIVKQQGSLLDFQTRLTQLSDSFRILGGRLYTGGTDSKGQTPESQPLAPLAQNSNTCPVACLDLIALSTAAARLSTSALVAPVFQSSPTPPTASTKGEYFVPLGSGSLSQLNTWVDVNTAQGSFDTSNYSSIKAFYFEVVMHIPSGQGEVRARLVDNTTPFIYAGEVLKTTSGTGALLSIQVPLRSGNKTYKVQMYTTVDTATLDQARIRIVTQ